MATRVSARLRPYIFWPHLILGIAAGLVILVMSVTGVLLTYQRQLVQWAERNYSSPPPAGATPLPVLGLVARAAVSFPSSGDRPSPPAQITIRRDEDAPAQIAVNGHTVFVNRYTGEVLGEGSTRLRAFFRGVTNWHRWLALEGQSRQTARAITGAANLIFVLLALSGLYLWWPRTWTVAAVRNITLFRQRLTPKARDFNWHNVFGFWMAIPIVLVAGSGVVISYPWASNLVYRAAGEAPPQRGAAPAPSQGADERRGSRSVADQTTSVRGSADTTPAATPDAMLAAAMAREPDWTAISFRITAGLAPVAVSIDRGTGGQPQRKSTLTLNARSGVEEHYERFSDQSRGRRWRSWLRFIHTGEAGGFWGQTLAGMASFAGIVLVYSGFALSWRRFFRRSTSTATSSRRHAA